MFRKSSSATNSQAGEHQWQQNGDKVASIPKAEVYSWGRISFCDYNVGILVTSVKFYFQIDAAERTVLLKHKAAPKCLVYSII